MSVPTPKELAEMPEYVLRYMAPMYGPGKPYQLELIRRRELEQPTTAAKGKQNG